ncbi:MAG: glycine cleavage system protein GcvH [Planctomycetota bacterium]|nr:glycine cleavage system protein GcvH [Pirellulaceae bacterium]MEC8161320.1 glycine cleavage system protein GcvH [Planctomycetota bacterium]
MKLEELLYADTHEWVLVEDQDAAKIATVGISKFAVEQLTDLVYIELPSVGTETQSGKEFGEVESVKAVSPLYSPVDGEVVEVNESLKDALETLNDDAYDGGWMIKVRLSDEASLSKLLDHAAYEKQCADES